MEAGDQGQVCEQNEPVSDVCRRGEPGASQRPLGLDMHLPTTPGAPQGEGPCTFHIRVPWRAEQVPSPFRQSIIYRRVLPWVLEIDDTPNKNRYHLLSFYHV